MSDDIIETSPGVFQFGPRVAGDVPQLAAPQRDRIPGRFGGKFPDSDHDTAVRHVRSQHEQMAGRLAGARLAVEDWQGRLTKSTQQMHADARELQQAKSVLKLYLKELRTLEYRYGGILQPIPTFKEEAFDVEQPA